MIIDSNERLSRFVLSRSEFRPSDQTVKPKAFVPPKNKSQQANKKVNDQISLGNINLQLSYGES